MIPDRTTAALPLGAPPRSIVPGGVIGPGPGRYGVDTSPDGIPAIRPWILEEWSEWLRERGIDLYSLPSDPVEISSVVVHRKQKIWTEPRVGAGNSSRHEPWPITHVMVMLGRWRPPYRTSGALLKEKELLEFWHRNSLPMYLIRGSARPRQKTLNHHSLKTVITMYRFFSRSNEAPLSFLQDVYHARMILPSLRKHRVPTSFTRSKFCNELRQELSDARVRREGLPQEPLSRVGRWYIHQRGVVGVPHDRVPDAVAAKLLPKIGLGRNNWRPQLLRAAFEAGWFHRRCVHGAAAKQQLFQLFAVFFSAPKTQLIKLSRELAGHVMAIPADVFDDGLCRGIRHYCRLHLQSTVLNKHLEFLWEQYEYARDRVAHHFEPTQ